MSTHAFHEPVFLSHSSRDKDIVTEFFRRLKRTRVCLWFDTLDIVPGEVILEKIVDGISRAQILVLFVSSNSVSSPWVKYEWTSFVSRRLSDGQPLYVIPILLDQVNPPDGLRQFRYIALDRSDIRSAVAETAEAIRKLAKKLADAKRGYQTLRLFDREKIVDEVETVVERHISIRPLGAGPIELDFHQWQTNPGSSKLIRTSVVDNSTQDIIPSDLSVVDKTLTSFHLRNRFTLNEGQVVTAMFEVSCKHYHADIFRIGYSQIDFLIRYPIEEYVFCLEVPKSAKFREIALEAHRGRRKQKVVKQSGATDRFFKVTIEDLFPMEELHLITRDNAARSL